MAAPRLFQYLNGRAKAVLAILTSAGAADADKIPALGAAGKLDNTFLNAVAASAGVGDAAKLPVLDGSGRLDSTFMPVGIGADTASVVASEALSAGDFVNIWNDLSVPKVRKADATVEGKEAHGFVLDAFASAATAFVYLEGRNTQLTGLTPGARQYLSTTAGGRTETPPATTGNVVQMLGNAVTATTLNFEPQEPITLA